MKTWLSAVMFLIVVLVVCTARAQESESLGDVARKSRSEKKEESKIVLTDQEHDQPATPAPSTDASVCGAPLPIMQAVYITALTGQKTPPEDEMAKGLLEWLNAHPDLEKMDPETLAKADDPRTEAQDKADQDLAANIAQSFTDEMIEYKKNHTDEEVQDKLAKLMSAKLPARQADVLESAVRDEKRRRESATTPPSDKDRLEEAVNLYAICENKRLIVSQGEVEKMSKSALKAKLEEAGFTIEPPATEASKGN